jgi:signal transduction histidine kinase
VLDITVRRAAEADRRKMTVLEDRERIARDLHDLVIQRLFAAGLGLQSVATRVSPPSAADRIEKTVVELDAVIRELRSAIFGLGSLDAPRPVCERVHGAIASHLEALGFVPTVTLPQNIDSVSLVVVEQLLPTIHEALSNIVRHADATSADITISLADGELSLVVTDNGKGLSDESMMLGLGLGNMEGRAQRLGGRCTIANGSECGATLTWTVPQ